MELRSLEYFVAVAEEGTVVAASDRVRITQPALSRQIGQLERELGLRLFDRIAGRLVLSSSGRELLPMARDLLTGAASLKRAAQWRAHGHLTSMTIAGPTTTLTDVVSPFIATLAPGDPTPSVRVLETVDRECALADGADLFIGGTPLGAPFTSVHVASLPVFVYVPEDHPWVARTTVAIDELRDEQVITLPRPFAARQAVDEATSRAGLEVVEVSTEVSNGTIAQALAAAGRGVALVTDDPRYGMDPLTLATDASGTPVKISLHASWSTNHPASTVLADIAARLAAWVDRRTASRPPTSQRGHSSTVSRIGRVTSRACPGTSTAPAPGSPSR